MRVTYRSKTWEFEGSMTVMQMLKTVKILPESVLVLRLDPEAPRGHLITEDQTLHPDDEVKLVAVISGG